ncbi:uncharacterized protein LOC123502655 [Portunus trituberculatus]|uniref:uncharacterized protein LOC123502655 n=1 Tax=Portunus trituberculatus TaxID=210409 RepID=UPI001E1D0181|nr:uncharacterized protein LOC123502655 [Portunus trituberculatus]XP_045107755.1 uncharacterized protein LOC123502655 [Portunus trituberculatus]XP_045107756.1 uncharacterized protein LOC123502655 [Portunus trituberculatus]
MLARIVPALLLLLAWASVPSAARPQHIFNPRPPTASDLGLQRVHLRPNVKEGTATGTGDYSDAVYAATLAKELTRLEASKKNVYVDFISSLYMNPEVASGFPPDLQRLSRGAPSPAGPVRVITSSSSSSFGPLPPASFPGHPHPGFAPGHRFPFRRSTSRR